MTEHERRFLAKIEFARYQREIRERTEREADEMREARTIAERTTRAAVRKLSTPNPFGICRPAEVLNIDGMLVTRMPGQIRR